MKTLPLMLLACTVALTAWAVLPVPEPSLVRQGYGIKDELVTLSINWLGNATGTGGIGSGTKDWKSGLAWTSFNKMTMLGNSGSFGGYTEGSGLRYYGEYTPWAPQTSDFALSVWYKSGGVSGNDGILFWNVGWGYGSQLRLHHNQARLYDSAGRTVILSYTNGLSLANTDWHHHVVVRRNSSNFVLYCDGVLQTQALNTAFTDIDVQNADVPCNPHVGRINYPAPGWSFLGRISLVTMWKGAGAGLSDQEVAELCQATKPKVDP